MIHRDLKPANILLTWSGIKILDFGLAKMPRSIAAGGDSTSHVTQEGAILGTLHYMSPEQVQGKDAGACSDIFSFGLVFYEMLTGRRAFSGDNPASVMAAILTAEPAEFAGPEVMEPVLRRCLAKDPEERWQSARDLKAALEWIAEGWHPAPTPSVATAAIGNRTGRGGPARDAAVERTPLVSRRGGRGYCHSGGGDSLDRSARALARASTVAEPPSRRGHWLPFVRR